MLSPTVNHIASAYGKDTDRIVHTRHGPDYPFDPVRAGGSIRAVPAVGHEDNGFREWRQQYPDRVARCQCRAWSRSSRISACRRNSTRLSTLTRSRRHDKSDEARSRSLTDLQIYPGNQFPL